MAEKLGEAIAQSPQAAALRNARDAVSKEKDLTDLLQQYREQINKISKLEEEKTPVEVEDKHKLSELQTKLFASEPFKKFTAAQVEYVDLMRKVNDVLRKQLMETEQN